MFHNPLQAKNYFGQVFSGQKSAQCYGISSGGSTSPTEFYSDIKLIICLCLM